MLLLDLIAERKIAEAIARGELDNLPGRGRPLDFGDDALVPAELRMAWRILKNAGFVPPEVEALRELGELERCMHDLQDGEAWRAAVRRLDLLRASLEARGRPGAPGAGSPYLDRVLRRLARPPSATPAP